MNTGRSETTVGGWVKKYRAAHAGEEPPLELSERARLRELKRRNRELEIENNFLKKSSSALRQGATVSEKFAFIDAERAQPAGLPTVERMCGLLEVSKSGFYEWRGRPASAAQQRRVLLADKIGALFEAFGGTYGYRRIHAELLRSGEWVGPELVRDLMGELGLVAAHPRPFGPPLTRTPTPPPALIWSTAISPPRGRAPRSLATSPMSGPGRAGCIWLR